MKSNRVLTIILVCIFVLFAGTALYAAAPVALSPIKFSPDYIKRPLMFSDSISLLLALSSISLVPFFLVTTTSFLRIIIVLGSLRMAMGTQQSPPNSVLIAISVFLTIFVMSNVWRQIDREALTPYNNGKISQSIALDRAMKPLKMFMLRQVKETDLALMVQVSGIKVTDPKNIPIWVVIPAYIMSEISIAFSISFVIFIPFVLIDLVVSNVLLSLGMFMLSPVMVSLPFKILLFVLADGFALITRGLILSFH